MAIFNKYPEWVLLPGTLGGALMSAFCGWLPDEYQKIGFCLGFALAVICIVMLLVIYIPHLYAWFNNQWGRKGIVSLLIISSVLLVVGVVGCLAGIRQISRGNFSSDPYPFSKSEPDQFTLLLGWYPFTYTRDDLEKSPKSPIALGTANEHPFKMYVENGRLYVDVDIYGGEGNPTITVKHGKPTATGSNVMGTDGDRQMSDRAFEVVIKDIVVFQMVLNDTDKVTISGMIALKSGQYALLTPGTISVATLAEVLPKNTLKPIFKYPSWKYPGVYADDVAAPQKDK